MKKFRNIYASAWKDTWQVKMPIAMMGLTLLAGAGIIAVSFHVPLSQFAARTNAGRVWMHELNMGYVNEFLNQHHGWIPSGFVQIVMLAAILWLGYTWFVGGLISRLAGSQMPYHVDARRCFWPILRLGIFCMVLIVLTLPAAFFGAIAQGVMVCLWFTVLMASDAAKVQIAYGSKRVIREWIRAFAGLPRVVRYWLPGYGVTAAVLVILYVGVDIVVTEIGRASSGAIILAFLLSQLFIWMRLAARVMLWSWTIRVWSMFPATAPLTEVVLDTKTDSGFNRVIASADGGRS
jgi:hypothetical protein